ncbi:MAG: hypothetical protein LW806_10735 [Planctomycetaceae bacterium]|nr:hypothetical protein [Planctomycetaceae bacterium]
MNASSSLKARFAPMRARPSGASLAFLSASCAALGAVVFLHALPILRLADERAAESARLFARASQLDALSAEREQLRADVATARAEATRVLREIPDESEQGARTGALMRALAVAAGREVGSQTIVAGDPVPALLSESPFRAVPLTVEMQASFARVMEILARAESDGRLVRPIRIEIARPVDRSGRSADERSADEAASGFVDATIELDAVYETARASAAPGGEESP